MEIDLRAVVLQYPIIQWYSFALSTDMASTVNRWFRGAAWENLQQYHAGSVRNETSTLFLNRTTGDGSRFTT